MSSMSTRSGGLLPRIAVASFVTYWLLGIGVSRTRIRSCAAWNASTIAWLPSSVTARHQTSIVPSWPPSRKDAAVVSIGSSRPEHPASAASDATAAADRNPRRVSIVALLVVCGSGHRQPHAHVGRAAVGPQVVRDRPEPADLERRDAAQQTGLAVLGDLGRGADRGIVEHDVRVVDALERVHERAAHERAAAAGGVDARV